MSLPRSAGWLCVAFGLAACAFALRLHFEIGLNSDNQLHLAQTQRWLEGRPLYTALMMPNPPMSFVLYAPVAAAHLALGLPIGLGFDLWTSALLAASLLTCRHVLVSIPALRDRLVRAGVLVLIAAGLVFLPLRDNVFGDRDHLFALLFTPYLLLQSPSAAPASLSRHARTWIGLLAAAGLAIKPHLFAIWGMGQLYWLLRERSPWRVLRRSETQAALAALAVYAAALAWLAPAYARTLVPMAWASYPAISPPLAHRLAMLARSWTWELALPLAGCAALLARGRSPALRARGRPALHDAAYLLCLCVGASASGVAGGWHYAWYPLHLLAFAFAANASLALLGAARDGWPASPARAAGWLLAGALLIVTPIGAEIVAPARARGAVDLEQQRKSGWPRGHQRAPAGVEAFLARQLQNGTPTRFLLLGNGMWDARLANFDPLRVSVGRFYALWPLPALVAARSDPQRSAELEWLRRELIAGVTADLREQKPDVVLVERSLWMWGLPRSFDVLGWFERDPDFARAFRDYTRVERVDECSRWPNFCAFDAYHRNEPIP